MTTLQRPPALDTVWQASDPVTMSTSFSVTDWQDHDRAARTPSWKRLAYRLARPLIGLEARRHLSAAAWRRWGVSWAFTQRGFPLEDRRDLAAVGTALAHATVLVQGTGSGWDVVSWAERRPKKIIAVDAWSFPQWDDIARHCRDRLGVSVEFHEAPLERCAFIADGVIDLCTSDAVFEHVRDLPAVLAESRRVLRSGGHLYAGFGPLWFAPGGDHFATRGGLDTIYAHIDREPDAYRAFFAGLKAPVEDFQSGGRYVELDLFSKLTVDEYLRDFRSARLRVDALIAEICPLALAYERRYPERVAALLTRHAGRITRDDLRTKALLVRLKTA